MSSMFKGLDSLIVLDLGNINMEAVKSANDMFSQFKSLKYVNLYNAKNTGNYISLSVLNEMETLTICQKDNIITNAKAKYDCCYFDIEIEKCKDKYIKVFYGKDVKYEKGFQNKGRNDIDFVFTPYNNLKPKLNQEFIIKEGDLLLIFLLPLSQNLFFFL